jgi:Ser/Thr protein kinase RdoA (MazF antagonist)
LANVMPTTSIQSLAYDILGRYSNLPRGTLVQLGNHGGFSGADLWRLETPSGAYALKAWPADGRAPADLAWIHALLAKASSLPWLPRVMSANDGTTFVACEGRLWELLTWMPGVADYWQAPSSARLTAALTALAQLHQTWRPGTPRAAVCPAVLRRMQSWQTWTQLLQSGWRPAWKSLDPYAPLTEQLWRMIPQQIDAVPRLLAPWLVREVPVQPCVCDLWHDHVLFALDAVTGIIDFGSVKVDHVSVDLARLLGSLIGADEAMWQIGVSAYQCIRPLSPDEIALARVLDHTGVLLAATHWLRWLYHDRRVYDSIPAVTARLDFLLRRLEAPRR